MHTICQDEKPVNQIAAEAGAAQRRFKRMIDVLG